MTDSKWRRGRRPPRDIRIDLSGRKRPKNLDDSLLCAGFAKYFELLKLVATVPDVRYVISLYLSGICSTSLPFCLHLAPCLSVPLTLQTLGWLFPGIFRDGLCGGGGGGEAWVHRRGIHSVRDNLELFFPPWNFWGHFATSLCFFCVATEESQEPWWISRMRWVKVGLGWRRKNRRQWLNNLKYCHPVKPWRHLEVNNHYNDQRVKTIENVEEKTWIDWPGTIQKQNEAKWIDRLFSSADGRESLRFFHCCNIKFPISAIFQYSLHHTRVGVVPFTLEITLMSVKNCSENGGRNSRENPQDSTSWGTRKIPPTPIPDRMINELNFQ